MKNDDDHFGVTRNPIFVAIHWLYLAFKWTILLSILVAFCNSIVLAVAPEAKWLMKAIPLTIVVLALITVIKNIYKKVRGQ